MEMPFEFKHTDGDVGSTDGDFLGEIGLTSKDTTLIVVVQGLRLTYELVKVENVIKEALDELD